MQCANVRKNTAVYYISRYTVNGTCSTYCYRSTSIYCGLNNNACEPENNNSVPVKLQPNLSQVHNLPYWGQVPLPHLFFAPPPNSSKHHFDSCHFTICKNESSWPLICVFAPQKKFLCASPGSHKNVAGYMCLIIGIAVFRVNGYFRRTFADSAHL